MTTDLTDLVVGSRRLHVVAGGAGAPSIVFLHGMGTSASSWRRCMQHLATHHRDTVQLLRAMLIGQHKLAKPLGGEFEHAVNAPQPVPPLRLTAGFRHRGGIDQPDRPAGSGPRHIGGQHKTNEVVQPGAAPAQPVGHPQPLATLAEVPSARSSGVLS